MKKISVNLCAGAFLVILNIAQPTFFAMDDNRVKTVDQQIQDARVEFLKNYRHHFDKPVVVSNSISSRINCIIPDPRSNYSWLIGSQINKLYQFEINNGVEQCSHPIELFEIAKCDHFSRHCGIKSLAFNKNKNLLAILGCAISIYWPDNLVKCIILRDDHEINCMVWKDNNHLLTVDDERKNSIDLWRVCPNTECYEIMNFKDRNINGLASADEKNIVVSFTNGLIELWDTDNKTCLKKYCGRSNTFLRQCLHKNIALFESSSIPLVSIIDIEREKEICSYLLNYSAWLGDVEMSPDGSFVACGDSKLVIRGIDYTKGYDLSCEEIYKLYFADLNCAAAYITTLAWSPDSKYIIAGFQFGRFAVWDAKSFVAIKDYIFETASPKTLKVLEKLCQRRVLTEQEHITIDGMPEPAKSYLWKRLATQTKQIDSSGCIIQ